MPGICCGLWVFFVPSWQARFPSNLSYARALAVEVKRAVAKQADGPVCLRKGNWSDCRNVFLLWSGWRGFGTGNEVIVTVQFPPPRFTSTRYFAPACCARLDGRGLEGWLGWVTYLLPKALVWVGGACQMMPIRL